MIRKLGLRVGFGSREYKGAIGGGGNSHERLEGDGGEMKPKRFHNRCSQMAMRSGTVVTRSKSQRRDRHSGGSRARHRRRGALIEALLEEKGVRE
ncbi:hypothetical protein V6N13_001698 [Hibiscus sabdariffa]